MCRRGLPSAILGASGSKQVAVVAKFLRKADSPFAAEVYRVFPWVGQVIPAKRLALEACMVAEHPV